MKKLALLVLVLAIALVGMFALTSCDCEHEYEEVDTKAATCLEAGTKTLTCKKCEESKTVEIPALGYAEHALNEETENVTVVPTLFTDGKATYTCSRCNASVEKVLPIEEADTVISAYNKGNGDGNNLGAGTWCTNLDLWKKNKAVEYGCDFLGEFSFFYNDSWYKADKTYMDNDTEKNYSLAKLANGGDTKINFRPFKESKMAVATLNIATGNFWATNVDSKAANCSSPDVSLAPGWHRLAIQIREEIELDTTGETPAVVYILKTRLFVDGECINDEGTWSVLKQDCSGLALKDYIWVTATVDTTDAANPKLQLAENARSKGDNMARCGDLWRTNTGLINYYGFAMFDDVHYSFDHVANTTEKYGDIFEVDVTPLNSELGYQNFYSKGEYVQFDLDGGKMPTVTVIGTQVMTEANKYASVGAKYEAYTMPWFQVKGATEIALTTPTKEGFTFVGWGKVYDTDNKVTYLKALWADANVTAAMAAKSAAATTVFAYTTADEWTAHDGMTINTSLVHTDSKEKAQVATPGNTANGTTNNSNGLFIAGKSSQSGLEKEAANVAVNVDGTAKYFILTADVKGKDNSGSAKRGITKVKFLLNNGETSYTAFKFSATAWGPEGLDFANTDNQYAKITVVMDVANSLYLYYVDGVLANIISAEVPANITSASIVVETAINGGLDWIENYTLSVIK